MLAVVRTVRGDCASLDDGKTRYSKILLLGYFAFRDLADVSPFVDIVPDQVP